MTVLIDETAYDGASRPRTAGTVTPKRTVLGSM
jgi:hypothetical protein